jgi:hypothetical protein
MTLDEYFNGASGKGVLSTADANGRVDAAIYSKPQILEDGTLVFIMRDHLTHHNIGSNPYATYLFIEDVPHYKGVRLFFPECPRGHRPGTDCQNDKATLDKGAGQSKRPKISRLFYPGKDTAPDWQRRNRNYNNIMRY